MALSDVDWSAAACPVSQHFSVRECLWLPTWKRLAVESDFNDPAMPWVTVCSNLYAFMQRMDVVRDWLGCAINVHVTARPPAYNLLIGGAKGSAHKEGKAVDWSPAEGPCVDTIARILGLLEAWDMRCENNGPFPSWIHLDCRAPGPAGRYFKP